MSEKSRECLSHSKLLLTCLVLSILSLFLCSTVFIRNEYQHSSLHERVKELEFQLFSFTADHHSPIQSNSVAETLRELGKLKYRLLNDVLPGHKRYLKMLQGLHEPKVDRVPVTKNTSTRFYSITHKSKIYRGQTTWPSLTFANFKTSHF